MLKMSQGDPQFRVIIRNQQLNKDPVDMVIEEKTMSKEDSQGKGVKPSDQIVLQQVG